MGEVRRVIQAIASRPTVEGAGVRLMRAFARPGAILSHHIPAEHNAFAYVMDGDAEFDDGVQPSCNARHLVVFGKGDRVSITAGTGGARFLLVSGSPLREPVAWGGPIVMSTQDELTQAFEDYRRGTFIKSRS